MPNRSSPGQQADYEWFMDSLADLYTQYGHRYLAIKNKTVLGAYDDFSEGVKATLQTEEDGTFIVQECGPDKESITWYYDPYSKIFCPIKSDEKCTGTLTTRIMHSRKQKIASN